MKLFKKIIFSLILIAGATLILLEAFGTINFGFEIWKGIITIFLTMIFVDSLVKLHFFPMLMTPAIFCVMFSEKLGLEAITPWPILFAAGLVGIALTILFGGHHKKCHDCCKEHHDGHDFEKEVIEGDEGNIDIDASFGAVAKYINTKKLERINLNLKFGAAKVYLDNAEIKGDTAVLDLHTTFSGAEIYVPKDWKVLNQTSASFGSVDEKNKPAVTSSKTLKITGSTSFAGVEIIYV